MGTHFTYAKAQVRALFGGFITVLDPKTPALGKLSRHFFFRTIVDELLPGIEDKERFMIMDWTPVYPSSIIAHKNVVGLIHHGGANSYFETTW